MTKKKTETAHENHDAEIAEDAASSHEPNVPHDQRVPHEEADADLKFLGLEKLREGGAHPGPDHEHDHAGDGQGKPLHRAAKAFALHVGWLHDHALRTEDAAHRGNHSQAKEHIAEARRHHEAAGKALDDLEGATE